MNRKIVIHVMMALITLVVILGIGISCVTKEYRKYNAEKAYHEFMEGKRNCMGQDILSLIIPTGEADRRYATQYYIVDSTGDGMPELHVWGHMCTIFTFEDYEMAVLDSFCSSSAGKYYLLGNGVMVYDEYVKDVFGNYYYYFILDEFGNHIRKLSFGWEDINGNNRFDSDDTYDFNGVKCTMDEWFEKTEGYLYIDENGRELVCGEAEWIMYCEAE